MWKIDARYFAALMIAVPVVLFQAQRGFSGSERVLSITDLIERQVERKILDKVNGLTVVNTKPYPPVQNIPASRQLRILVTGGAGFVGSHLVDRLMSQGHQVTVLDNLFTGSRDNIQHWIGHPNFNFVVHDVTEPFHAEVDQIYHLACPASPPHYQVPILQSAKFPFESIPFIEIIIDRWH